MATLRHVLLLQRDVPRAARFYSEGLGLPVAVLTERWAELRAGSTSLALKAVDGCAPLCLARGIGVAQGLAHQWLRDPWRLGPLIAELWGVS